MPGTGRAPSKQATPGEPKQHQQQQSNGLVPLAAAHRDGSQRGRVTDIQRARVLTAMVEVACERGAANVTVGHVVARAGVSRRTFYELFGDREDCFLAAFEEAIGRASRLMSVAQDITASWVDRVRAALIALLGLIDEQPNVGRLLVVESLGGGPSVLERRKQVLARLIAAVDVGREETRTGANAPRLAAEGVVGGVLAVLHARLSEPSPPGAMSLTSELMSMIVLPYRGTGQARRELERPTPANRPSAHAHTADIARLNQLDIRLTYRTIRVLAALATNPGSSNRQVAEASGIADQGQMSKLLGRLRQLGLIQNTGTGGTRGEPNAWTLTSQGWQIQSALAQQNA